MERKRKLVYGVGVNDVDYKVYEYEYINGKQKIVWTCRFYRRWYHMLGRCYSQKYQTKKPTYKGCTVCEDWLLFSNFKSWMEQQDWEGNQLDKDLLVEGNKVYSPDTCVFVTSRVNNFTIDRGIDRGDYPIGVCKDQGKYRASCSSEGQTIYLGLYNTPEEAHQVWKEYKHKLACELADSDEVTDERVKELLRTRYKP